jgi:hypothetical protein
MAMKKIIGVFILSLVSATCFGQGLTDPYRWYSPRLNDPSRLSFSGRADFDRNLNINDGRFDRSPPQLIGLFPGRFFDVVGNDPINGAPGGPSGISNGNFDRRFHGGAYDDFFLFNDPELQRTFGYNAYSSATGVGNRAAGIGTGVGNKFAGLGAYYYGQGAGLGMFASGMGDFYAGQGRLLEGQGAYEQLNSQANINNEEAEYRDMKNDEYNATAFFNKRRTNLESRRYENEMRRYAVNRLSNEQLAKIQQDRTPDRLDFQQYDETTGALAWPALLKHPEFAESRQQINRLFANRTKLGASTGLGSENYREIRRIAQQLEEDLKATMPELAPMEYTMAKNFLRSLEYEAQHPMVVSFPVARVADAR